MFLLITSMMFSVALFADNDQTYFFTKEHINEHGIYNMNYSFATDMPVEQAYSILKSWLIGLDVQERSLTIDRKNEELGATIAFNTKVTYNPFAGAFSEFLYVDIQILINDGSVECKFDNFQIMFFTHSLVRVAVPESLCMRLSPMRSPVRREMALPFTSAIISPRRISSPSFLYAVNSMAVSSFS